MSAELSVVVPVRDGEPYLRYQLEALERQQCGRTFEVIVVDNGSSDRSAQVAKDFEGRLPGLRVLHEPVAGKARALNAGIRGATGRLLLFLDADDEVAPDYLEAMARALETAEWVGARWDLVELNPPWARYPSPPRDDLQVGGGFLAFSPGGSLGVHAALARRIGLFDEAMPLADDVDFCWRAGLAGAPGRFVPDAVVHVRRPADALGAFRRTRGYGRSHVLLYARYRDRGLHRRTASEVRADAFAIWHHLRRREPHWTWRVAFLAGFFVGRVEQSITSRALYL